MSNAVQNSNAFSLSQSLTDVVVERKGRHKRTHHLGEWAPPTGVDEAQWLRENKARIDAWQEIFEIEKRAWALEAEGKLFQADMLIYQTDAMKFLRGFR